MAETTFEESAAREVTGNLGRYLTTYMCWEERVSIDRSEGIGMRLKEPSALGGGWWDPKPGWRIMTGLILCLCHVGWVC